MAQIFISYSSADEAIAREVLESLREHGFGSVFLSADREDGIRPGEDWERRIYGQLRACSLMLPLLSPRWLASPWCHAELRIGRCLGKKIYPVLVERCTTDGVAPELQHVDLNLARDGLASLGRRLQVQLGRRRQRWTGGCPFPGLEAFDEAHAGVFFGRDADIQRVAGRVREIARAAPTGEGRRALILSGPSGVGKSSLLRAGVIAELREHSSGSVLVLPVLRPRTDFANALAMSVATVIAQTEERKVAPADLARVRAALVEAKPAEALAVLLADCAFLAGAGDGIVLPIDQGEELLGGVPERTESALRLLVALMRQDAVPFTLLATARSSEAVLLAAHLAAEITPVAPLSAENWREVVAGPLEAAGVDPEEAFIDCIQRDAAGAADALPLVAHLMTRLWQGGTGFTALSYAAAGGLAASVSEAAEQLWEAHATGENAAAIRRAFVPLLASVTAEGTPILGTLPVAAAPPEAHAALGGFVDRRLLRIGADRGEPVYEAAHEALLRRWPRLAEWLVQARDGLVAVGALQAAAQVWAAAGRTPDYLDHRGDRLLAAQRALADTDIAAKIASVPELADYLDACRAAEAARAEAAARHQAELAAREHKVALARCGLFATEAQRANDAAEHDRALRIGLAGWIVAREAGVEPPPALMAQLARGAFHDRLLRALPDVYPAHYDQLATDGRYMLGQAADGAWHRLDLAAGGSEWLKELDGIRRVRLVGTDGWAGIDADGWLTAGRFAGGEPAARIMVVGTGAALAFSPGGAFLLVTSPDHGTALHDWPSGKERWRTDVTGSGLLTVGDDGRSLIVSHADGSPTCCFGFDPLGTCDATHASALQLDVAAASDDGRLLCLAGRKDADIAESLGQPLLDRRLPGRITVVRMDTGEEQHLDHELSVDEYSAALLCLEGQPVGCSNGGRLRPLTSDRLPAPGPRNAYCAVPGMNAFLSVDDDGVRLWAPRHARHLRVPGDRSLLPGFARRGADTVVLFGNKDGEEIDPRTGASLGCRPGWDALRSAEMPRPDGGTDCIGVRIDGAVLRLDGASGAVEALFAPDGRATSPLTLSVAADGTILVVADTCWRLLTTDGLERAAFAVSQDEGCAQRLLDGRHIDGVPMVAVQAEDRCRIYHAETADTLGDIDARWAYRAMLLPACRVLLVTKRRALLVDWMTGATVNEFELSGRVDHTPGALSPDGRRIILDRRIWDLASGQPLAAVPHDLADGAQFSADGAWLAWNDEGGGATIVDARWLRLDGDDLIRAICEERLAGAQGWWPGDLVGTTLVDPDPCPAVTALSLLRRGERFG